MAAADYQRLLERLDGLRYLGVELGLERVHRALASLGSPEARVPAIQIAGTNGKGSTAAMTDAVLRAAGWRTGLYTSPHLSRFTERIRVDGVEVDGDRLARLDARVAATGVALTYFEVATLLAFLAMAGDDVDDQGHGAGAGASVDLAVLETGLGGRLDAVTACRPLATAITSIGWDHMDYLGATLTEIAREKAGIMKPGVPCFVGRLPAEADAEVARVADAVGAPLRRAGVDFDAPVLPENAALRGAHQRSNAALAVALATEAGRRLGRPIPRDAIAAGLARVSWPGRLESIGDDLLLDCAHNPEGAEALAAALPEIARGRPIALVTSVVADKDVAGLMRPLLPLLALVVATRSRNRRARAPEDLAQEVAKMTITALAGVGGPAVVVRADPGEALAEARRQLAARFGGGLVVVAGSIFLVGEVRGALLGEPSDPRVVSDPL